MRTDEVDLVLIFVRCQHAESVLQPETQQAAPSNPAAAAANGVKYVCAPTLNDETARARGGVGGGGLGHPCQSEVPVVPAVLDRASADPDALGAVAAPREAGVTCAMRPSLMSAHVHINAVIYYFHAFGALMGATESSLCQRHSSNTRFVCSQ